MNVLYAYDFCNFGGVATVLKHRDAELRARSINPSYLFDRDNGGFAHFQEFTGGRAELDYRHLERAIADLSPTDSVVVFDDPVLALRAAEAHRGQVILEVHSSLDRSLDRLTPFNTSAVTRIVVPSVWSKGAVQARVGDGQHEIVVVPNFCGPEFAPPGDVKIPTKWTFVWVGKLVDDKNYSDAVRIFGLVAKQIPSCSFIFVTGGAPQPADVRRFLTGLRAANIADRTSWLSNLRQAEVASVLCQATEAGGALLSTSKFESFGLALLEGMSVGLPIVFYDACALREIEPTCFTGRVEVGDCLGASDLLLQLASMPERYPSLSKKISSEAKKFDAGKIMDRYVAKVLTS